jgi:hypothetical protein
MLIPYQDPLVAAIRALRDVTAILRRGASVVSPSTGSRQP